MHCTTQMASQCKWMCPMGKWRSSCANPWVLWTFHYTLNNHPWNYIILSPLFHWQFWKWTIKKSDLWGCTTTTWGYFAIQISSQTTKKDVSEIPLLRTIIPRKLLSFCDTITFAPVQSQVLRNSWTWYNHKTFPITIASIHCLRLTLHRKLFATNPSPQQLSELAQKSIGFRYKI